MVVISSGRGPGSWPRPSPADSLIETADTPKMVSRATLICRPNSHPFKERHLTLEKPEKIGRSVARVRATPTNAIFDCKVLSRNHALLWFENGKFFLQDTKSSNGTFVNNQRLSKSSEESPPRELCSGDIVQFGVDVLENSKKVTHGCIVATLKLYLPDGKEAKASPASIAGSAGCPLQSAELYQLQQFVQEAVHREQSVETKLATLQRLMDGVRTATDSSWKALIDEDRLLSRLEMLEGQHALYSKNFGEDKLREELGRLQEDKNTFQSVAKESLKKVLQEKLEAVRKLQELERCLSSAEDERRHQTELRESAVCQLADLAVKYEAKLSEVEEQEAKVKVLEAKLQWLQEEMAAAEWRWQQEREQQEVLSVEQRAEEAQQRARLEAVQAESDFTKEQLAALRHKLNNKLAEPTPNGDLGGDCAGMRQTEQQLEAVRAQLSAAETQLSVSARQAAQLKEDLSKSEAEMEAFKEKTTSLEVELAAVRTEAAHRKEEASRLEQEVKEKEAELQQLLKQSSAGDADIKDQAVLEQLRGKVTELNELLVDARQQRQEVGGRLERAETALLVTRNNAQEASLRADDARTQLKEAELRLAVRTERQEQLQQQVLRLAASVSEAVTQLQLMQQRHDGSQQEAEQRQARAQQLQELLTSAESRLAESAREGDTLRRQLTELRAETDTAWQQATRRQAEVDSAQHRLQELEQRLKECAAEREQQQVVGGGGERPDADDTEKSELRRQLRQMDDQLKELSLQNRTMDTSTLVALVVLVVALFVGLLVMSS